MTIRDRVHRAVFGLVVPRTAVDIQRIIRVVQKTDVPLSSLSSQLRRMADRGELTRWGGVGPRGGFGYTAALPTSG